MRCATQRSSTSFSIGQLPCTCARRYMHGGDSAAPLQPHAPSCSAIHFRHPIPPPPNAVRLYNPPPPYRASSKEITAILQHCHGWRRCCLRPPPPSCRPPPPSCRPPLLHAPQQAAAAFGQPPFTLTRCTTRRSCTSSATPLCTRERLSHIVSWCGSHDTRVWNSGRSRWL